MICKLQKLYVYIQIVKFFESPKALYKFSVIITITIITITIIITIMFIVIITLSVLLILCRACVCKVRLGLTLDVSALSVLFYIAYPITRTTCKSKLLICPQNVKARSSRTRAYLLWTTCSALPHHMYTPVRSCVSHITGVAPRSTWLVDAFW